MKKRNRDINVQEHILPDGSLSSELREFLENAASEMKKYAVNHKQPPWKAFPGYDRYSMGWRMGAGEDYWHAFHSWIRTKKSADFGAFVSKFPEPEEWKGFYESIGIGK